MNHNLKDLLANNLELEKPLSQLCVLSQNEEIYKGLIKCSFLNSDIKKYIDSVGSYVKSSYFIIGSPNYCSFRFLLYPNGKNDTLKGFVSLIIQFYCELPESAWLEGALRIFNEDSKTFCTGGCTSSIDIDNFIKTQKIKERICTSDNNLVIQCSMKMKLRVVKCDFDGSTIQYSECRGFNAHTDSLLKNKCFTDVTFHLDGGDVKAHKAVLAKVPFFRQLFDDFDGEQTVQLTNIKKSTFIDLIEFLYTNDIPVLNFQLACELYIVASDLEIRDLKYICSSYFGANLTEENVFIVISLAHKYNDIVLKKSCIKFIKDSDIEKLATRSVIL